MSDKPVILWPAQYTETKAESEIVLRVMDNYLEEVTPARPWFTQTIRTAGRRWRDQNHPPEMPEGREYQRCPNPRK